MQHLAFILSAVLVIPGCSVLTPAPKPAPAPAPEPSSVTVTPSPAGKHTFSIVNYRGFGHGCAVNGKTITNRHMVEEDDTDVPEYFRFRYAFPDGPEGRGKPGWVSLVADLAVVELSTPPATYGVLAPKEPAIGEVVMWVEFDFRTQDTVFQPRIRKGTITTIAAGHAILAEGITSGASGGCAYNAAGEVLGIMTFSTGTADRKPSAGLTALWGDWWKDVSP